MQTSSHSSKRGDHLSMSRECITQRIRGGVNSQATSALLFPLPSPNPPYPAIKEQKVQEKEPGLPPIIVPGPFMVAQGIPGDGLANTLNQSYNEESSFHGTTTSPLPRPLWVQILETRVAQEQAKSLVPQRPASTDDDDDDDECAKVEMLKEGQPDEMDVDQSSTASQADGNSEAQDSLNIPPDVWKAWSQTESKRRSLEMDQWWHAWKHTDAISSRKGDAQSLSYYQTQHATMTPWWRHPRSACLASFASLADIQSNMTARPQVVIAKPPQGWLPPGVAVQGLEVYGLSTRTKRATKLAPRGGSRGISMNRPQEQPTTLPWNYKWSHEVLVMKYREMAPTNNETGDCPTTGYCVFQMDGYNFLYPGALADHAKCYLHPDRWFWKVTNVKGVEMFFNTGPLTHLAYGCNVQVLERRPSAKHANNFVLKLVAHLPRTTPRTSQEKSLEYEHIEGFAYQFDYLALSNMAFLQPLPLFVPVPMRMPYGSRISSQPDSFDRSLDLRPAPPGARVVVTERAFVQNSKGHASLERLRLADCDGWFSLFSDSASWVKVKGDVVARPYAGFDSRFDPHDPAKFFFLAWRHYLRECLIEANPHLPAEVKRKTEKPKPKRDTKPPPQKKRALAAIKVDAPINVEDLSNNLSQNPALLPTDVEANLRFPMLQSCPSPLHLSVAVGDLLACAREVEHAATEGTLNQVDKEERTALDVAALMGRPDCFDVIQEHGGCSKLFSNHPRELNEMLDTSIRDPQASRRQILWGYNLMSRKVLISKFDDDSSVSVDYSTLSAAKTAVSGVPDAVRVSHPPAQAKDDEDMASVLTEGVESAQLVNHSGTTDDVMSMASSSWVADSRWQDEKNDDESSSSWVQASISSFNHGSGTSSSWVDVMSQDGAASATVPNSQEKS